VSTVPATVVALAVLSGAGLVPTVALVGLRWVTVPLVPLCGSVVAGAAATCFLAVGGTFMGWFVGLSVAGVAAAAAHWVLRPGSRPFPDQVDRGARRAGASSIGGALGAVAILGSCVWCLRGLATPTVGFDARAVWLLRAGWFLQSHQQLLVKMRVGDVVLIQSAYPPLVSAAAAVAASVTGDQSIRLGVVVVALLNTCALAAAAFAVVEAGRRFTGRLPVVPSGGLSHAPAGAGSRVARAAPSAAGAVAAAALVFVAFGITEPFMTNGYADPLWSLAAVGAVAYGLQLGDRPPDRGATLILLLVTGMTKDEGLVTGAALIVLVGLRGLLTMTPDRRRTRWWRPVLVGGAELAVVAAWPLLIRVLDARGASSGHSPVGAMPGRARATFNGMTPYLHVVVLAAPLAIVGGLVLARVRRASGVANDGWGWAALAAGVLAIGGALVVGTGAIEPWLQSTVHRVTEFGALAGWWIVAMWAVVAAGAPASARLDGVAVHRARGIGREGGPAGRDVDDRRSAAAGAEGLPGGWMDPGSVGT
jgi:hypothetical protein